MEIIFMLPSPTMTIQEINDILKQDIINAIDNKEGEFSPSLKQLTIDQLKELLDSINRRNK
jgi:hypothetical protein